MKKLRKNEEENDGMKEKIFINNREHHIHSNDYTLDNNRKEQGLTQIIEQTKSFLCSTFLINHQILLLQMK